MAFSLSLILFSLSFSYSQRALQGNNFFFFFSFFFFFDICCLIFISLISVYRNYGNIAHFKTTLQKGGTDSQTDRLTLPVFKIALQTGGDRLTDRQTNGTQLYDNRLEPTTTPHHHHLTEYWCESEICCLIDQNRVEINLFIITSAADLSEQLLCITNMGVVYNAYSVYVETPVPLVAVGLTYFK